MPSTQPTIVPSDDSIAVITTIVEAVAGHDSG